MISSTFGGGECLCVCGLMALLVMSVMDRRDRD